MFAVKLNPPQVILASYLGIIGIGTLLFVLLPVSYREISFVDALFTVTSAVTVTGLTVLDTERELNLLGQSLLLLLFQIGGLGYMTIATFFLITLRRKIGLKDRLILAESLNYPGIYGLVRFLKRVVVFVLAVELIGFLLLYAQWSMKMGLSDAFFPALFHSVSAFNNAGLSTFSDSLSAFRGNLYTNLVFMALIVVGGLGFFVVNDLFLWFKDRAKRLSTHTKLVLLLSAGLILTGWLGLLMTEAFHERGIWSLSWKERLLSTLFLSVSSRTAGFTTVDVGMLSESSAFLLMILMFIGASPGGTGGGVKTTAFAVVVITVISYVKGRKEVVAFGRTVSEDLIRRAMVVLFLSFSYIALVNLTIDRLEEKDFLATLFEVVSAFSTVGLSVGNPEGLSFSADFSPVSKLLIILSMLVGRVGVLSFTVAIMGRETPRRVKYPPARLLL